MWGFVAFFFFIGAFILSVFLSLHFVKMECASKSSSLVGFRLDYEIGLPRFSLPPPPGCF
jgi:hypothetical protein